MRTFKIIAGIVCWASALVFFLGITAMPVAAVPLAVPAILFAGTGWLLISKSTRPTSRTGKAMVTVVIALLFGGIIFIAVPDFIAARYERSQNVCVNNLRQLQAAKQEWALENGKPNGTIVTVADITPYIQLDSNGNIPKCPAGGKYILGRVGEDVRCSIGVSDWPNRHTLSDTNNFIWADSIKGAYGILFGFRHVQKP